MTAIAFPILLLLVLVMGEMLLLNREGRERIDWHDVAFNLNSGHLILWLFRSLEIAVYGFVLERFSFGWLSDWPQWALWLFALLAWDFLFYWLHRLHHKFAMLWAIHVVHHEGEHFNLSLAVRNSWYSSLASIPFFLPMALLGVPLEHFITVSILHYGIQLMNHSALTPHLGFLEKILVTPEHHRIHHVADRAWSDRNYAGSFVIWDKIFGTYRADLPEGDFAYGVKGAKPSLNPALANNLPFLRFVLHLKPPAPRAPQYAAHGLMVMAGTLLIFALVTGYIWHFGYDQAMTNSPQLRLFGLLALGAVALGAISEGRLWALVLWFWIAVALLVEAVVMGRSLPWQFCAVLLLVHSVVLLLGVGRRPSAAKESGLP